MSLLLVRDVQKHFGAQAVLRGATFQIDPGEKLGLVGRNGGGKTTLLGLIAGVEQPDWGEVQRRRNTRIGWVPQRPEFARGTTVRSYVAGGLDEARQALLELDRLGEEMAHAQGEALDRLLVEHAEVAERVERLGAWEIERRVETVLSGIGLAPELWDREAATLSGGEKSRTALARELAAAHDLLLLDEPTNHLDLEGIEWIESWLRELAGAVVVVSHDRRLLDRAVDGILELEHGRLNRYPGRYSKYLALKEERYQGELRAYEQQRDQMRKEEAFIKKHMGSQRTSEAKGRMKRLKGVERLERPHHDVRRPLLRAPEAGRGGEVVLETFDLAFGYEGHRALFSHVELRVGRGDRIGIVGRNGAGKSTLIKLLAGRGEPTAGRVVFGHGALCGYYDQDTSHLAPDGTPLGELRKVLPLATDQELRDHLARFLFRGDEVEKSIAALSGGERARVSLAQLVVGAPTWLALDEPTNHLDLAGRTALEEMLSAYQGALVCISHDREFLDGLCNRILEVEAGTVRQYTGNYSEWRAQKLAQAERDQLEAARLANLRKEAERKLADQRARSAAPAEPAPRPKPKGKPNPWKLERVEKRIMELEATLARLNEDLAREDVYRDPARLKETQFQVAETERELALANEEWERLA